MPGAANSRKSETVSSGRYERIVARGDGDNLRVPFRQQRSGHARRAAPRQRDFLAERELRQPRQQLIFSVALELRGNSGQNRYLHKIHQVQVAQQPQAHQSRRPRMKRQRLLYPIALEQWLPPRHLLKHFRRQAFPLQYQANMRFVERRIVKQREDHFRGRVMQQNGQFFARSDERAFSD